MGTSLSTRTCGCRTTCVSVPAATAVLRVKVVVPLDAGEVRFATVMSPLSAAVTAAPVTNKVSSRIDTLAPAKAVPDSATSPSECDHVQVEGITTDALARV